MSSEQLVRSSSLEQQWNHIQALLKRRYGEAIFLSWFQPLSPGPLEGQTLTLYVPTPFFKDWLKTHYREQIESFWASENPLVRYVEFVVPDSSGAENSPSAIANTNTPLSLSFEPANDGLSPSTCPLPLKPEASTPDTTQDVTSILDARFTFENFVVGKPNELAYAAARRVSESDHVPFNPLFLYGGVGLGKTHLMHAIAWHIQSLRPQRRVLYLSAEKFMYQFIRALRYKDTMAFKEQFRSVDVLMIDDVQFISGKDSTQEEFFHTFNALVDQNRQIIISADKSPSDLEGMEERLKSRLGWGLVADIHPTNYELRLGILHSKVHQWGIPVPQKVLELLASKITSNVRELEGALTSLMAHAQLVGRDITVETTQDVLKDLFRSHDKRLTIDEIQKRVAEHFGIRLADMHSDRRLRSLARPRQIAMYLAKKLTSFSLPEIGRRFGGRDHTTVIHAVQKIDQLRSQDPELDQNLAFLQRVLS